MTKTMIQREIGGWSVFVILIWLLSGCQGSNDGGAASVHLTLALPHSNGASKAAFAPAPSDIGSIHLDITGPGMDPLSTSVPLNSDREGTLVIEVPPGPARRFVVTAFDTENTPRFLGEATVDLTPGSSPNLTISMVSLDISVPGPTPSIEISPRTAIIPKDSSQFTFSVSGIDLSQVQWEVSSEAGNDPDKVGSVATDGDYAPPATIPTDAANGLIGNPIPVTVTAIDKTTPSVRDSATVILTTGAKLTFEKNQRVSPTTGSISTDSSGQRSILFNQGKLYAVWSDSVHILFSESTDGVNWTNPPEFVATNDSGLASPSLAVSPEGAVYVAYTVCPFCSTATIQLATRPFSGGPFKSIPLDLGTSPQTPTVAVASNGTAFVAWSDTKRTTGPGIYLQRIPTDKQSNPINTASNNINPTHPAISISNSGEVFLAWEETNPRTFTHNIFGTVSLDKGNTFLPEVQISGSVDTCCGVSSPTLAAGPSDTIYVAFDTSNCDCSAPSVFFNRGQVVSGKLTFGSQKQIDVPSLQGKMEPSIAWDGIGGVYIAFHGTIVSTATTHKIILVKSLDEGVTFSSSQIDDDTASLFINKFSPSLAVDRAGRAFAIWSDARFGFNQQYDVFFAKGE